MRYAISQLDSAHNDELLALAATTDTGSAAFRVDRSPDFFALARDLGESTYWGAWADGRLTGCIGVTKQKRFLAGVVQELHYIHDLRVHPAHRGAGVLHALLDHVRKERLAEWGFATILDTNEHSPMLTRGNGAASAARPIGNTVHVGVPLFLPLYRNTTRVVRLDPDAAWAAYASLAPRFNFAPADEERFHQQNGFFLGIRIAGTTVAVCKVVDQTAARRIVATRPFPLASRLLDLACRARGRACHPRPGHPLRHVYLAYCASRPEVDRQGDFTAYLARASDHDYTYVFVGLSRGEAARRRSILGVTLSSTTYAYGTAPAALSCDFHELTLI